MTDAAAGDLSAAEAAILALMRAAGAPVETDPELAGTPARAARALLEELLDGYRVDPRAVLADALATSEAGLVVLRNVRFASMCPHHFLPSAGFAHVGYLPGARVVGLGTLVALVEAFAHRLILQETLGQRIADALVAHLGARGAGVVIEARHACLSSRGERQADALVVTTASAGVFRTDAGEREAFLRAVGGTRGRE
jgi:GTP cyclohydrolase I